MPYRIKEIFYTLQGEGVHTGRPAVFFRFSGCNLWSGNEKDRDRALCKICDTDFVGTDGIRGGVYKEPLLLVGVALELFPRMKLHTRRPFVVFTGGEPLLQVDDLLIHHFHEGGFEIAVETNGTLKVPSGIDWITVSPKGHTELKQKGGDELKLLYPQEGVNPEEFVDLPFTHFCLQPIAGPFLDEHTKSALDYCLKHPEWSLSVQMHKIIGIP